jgi:hypothetical protein
MRSKNVFERFVPWSRSAAANNCTTRSYLSTRSVDSAFPCTRSNAAVTIAISDPEANPGS